MVFSALLSVEFKDYFRSPVTAFWTFVYPFLVLGFLIAVFGDNTVAMGEGVAIDYGAFLLCGMVCINIVATSLFGFTLPLVENRNKGALKMYHLFPIWTPAYILAVVVSRVVIATLFNLAFLVVTAYLLGVEMSLSLVGWLNFLALVLLASTAFISVGMFLASVCDKTSTTTTVTNIVFFPLLFLSNVFFPDQALPEFFRSITQYSPLQSTVNTMREIVLNGESVLVNINTVVILTAITLAFAVLSVRFFRWR